MATTEILQFAGGGSANVLTQAQYAALTSILANGFSAGTAQSPQLNKVWRQSSFIAAGIANWLVNRGITVPDDGNLANLVAEIEQGLNAYLAKSVAGNTDVTLSPTTEAVFPILDLTGVLTGNINVIFPSRPGTWVIRNSTTGAFQITAKTAAGSGVILTQGYSNTIYSDGVNIYPDGSDFAALFSGMVASAGGTADAITGTFTPPPQGYMNGVPFFIRAASANLTTTPTFTPNSGTVSPATIVKGNNLPLAPGDIAGAGHWLILQYDGTLTKYVLLNPATGINSSLVNLGQLKNGFINGGSIIAQRPVANLSTTPTYGQVDRFAAWATGTAVSAGTITQDTASPAGRTGYALKLAGVTITGSGAAFARQRIESLNAKRFKNQTASFSAIVYQDTGASINYVITVRKPNTSDNYGATTTIATRAAISVPNAAATLISLPNITMGDCSNGIEVEIQSQCGAVTTKNFSFTEWQLEEGATTSSFERREYATELLRCQRYYEVLGDENNSLLYTGYNPTAVASAWNVYFPFKVPKRVAAVATKNGTWSLAGAGSPNQPTVNGSGTQGVIISFSTGATIGGFQVWTGAAGQNVTADSDL